ncbi:methyltransferase domain-containing protein [Streptomyces avermitilis]|uniref:Methyltransferase domain-containing protein n=1 Tax=Streptomyces avermitilis TaxID=33903 RepID=A0A4D4MB19_STRAX|nr:methyltransferase domain-containing protein [Streptomyces avermitilis]GDY68819.1 hypothetical protein SAV14893_082120 [Streptomyces avermitilis]GDY70796.1 hypothetical protein SAV31267_002810 [Streptomyces avermitilis]
MLDLGAGPGVIALDPAPRVGTVIAVDPEKGMLEEGRRLAAEQGITNIDWREGGSTTLPAMDIGHVLLTVMGAAYHWMERDRVARHRAGRSDRPRLRRPRARPLAAGRRQGPHPLPRPRAPCRLRHLLPPQGAPPGRPRPVPVLPGRHRALGPHPDLRRGRGHRPAVFLQLLQLRPTRRTQGRLRKRDLRQALTDFSPVGTFDEVVHTEAIIATRS